MPSSLALSEPCKREPNKVLLFFVSAAVELQTWTLVERFRKEELFEKPCVAVALARRSEVAGEVHRLLPPSEKRGPTVLDAAILLNSRYTVERRLRREKVEDGQSGTEAKARARTDNQMERETRWKEWHMARRIIRWPMTMTKKGNLPEPKSKKSNCWNIHRSPDPSTTCHYHFPLCLIGILGRMTTSGSQSYSVLQTERELMLELDDNRRAGPSSLPDKDIRGVSRRNKAMAAISGAAVTSLLSEY
jgi:hypothetical protein